MTLSHMVFATTHPQPVVDLAVRRCLLLGTANSDLNDRNGALS